MLFNASSRTAAERFDSALSTADLSPLRVFLWLTLSANTALPPQKNSPLQVYSQTPVSVVLVAAQSRLGVDDSDRGVEGLESLR